MAFHAARKGPFFKFLSIVQITVFLFSSMVFPFETYAQSVNSLPLPGSTMSVSSSFSPAILRGVRVDVNDPLMFDFILDKGQSGLEGQALTAEGQRMIKYFLTALTVPEADLWVNLSPYEADRIIPEQFGRTEMGRDLLAQDYILKQMASSLTHPDTSLGAEFWGRVYARVRSEFGTAQVPVNVFHKVWIMPDRARIFEKQNGAFIVENRLKVLMEKDYLALENSRGGVTAAAQDDGDAVSDQVLREIIIPELTREVNEGRNFAPLRQVYNSLLLAAWYRGKVKASILGSTYLDQNRTAGSEIPDMTEKDRIYRRYVEAFKKGAYDYIKEDTDPVTQETMAHKYFSGGMVGQYDLVRDVQLTTDAAEITVEPGNLIDLRVAGKAVQRTDKKAEEFRSNVMNVLDAVDVAVLEKGLNGPSLRLALQEAQDVKRIMVPAASAGGVGDGTYEVLVRQVGARDLFERGFALDHENKVIYINEGFEPGFNFFERKGIELFADTPEEGRKLEYRYAKSLFPDEIEALFPSDGEPEEVIGKIRADLLFTDDVVNTQKLKRVAADILNRPVNEVAIDTSLLLAAKDVNLEALQMAEDSLYLIGINALDGTNYADHQVFSLNSVKDSLSVGQLSSKFAPITIAHMIVTILRTYAWSGANGFYVNVSEFDPRKPEVPKSFAARKALGDSVVRQFFGGLVRVLEDDRKQENGQGELRIWNGEEVFIKMIQESVATNSRSGKKFFYTAGGDHFYVWTPIDPKEDKVKLVIFDKVLEDKETSIPGTDDIKIEGTRKYYTFYADLDPFGYQQLVLDQQAFGERQFFLESPSEDLLKSLNISGEQMAAQKKFFDDIKNATTEEGVRTIVRGSAYLPRLDTVGKMFLAQRAGQQNVRVVLAHTNRPGENRGDAYRDKLIDAGSVGVMNVAGLKGNIAATFTRNGLKAYALSRGRTFSFSLFFGNVKSLLKSVLAATPAGRKLLYLLMRQEGLDTPYAMQVMVPADSEREDIERTKVDLLKKLQGDIFGPKVTQISFDQKALAENQEAITIFDGNNRIGYFYEKVNESDRVSIEVQNGRKEVTAVLEYHVKGKFDADGGDLNIVQIVKQKGDDRIISLVKEYVMEVNGARQIVVDAAEDVEPPVVAEQIRGGIDFDMRALRLEVTADGQEVRFNIDPGILQDTDFGGLIPVILNITPVTDIPGFLSGKV